MPLVLLALATGCSRADPACVAGVTGSEERVAQVVDGDTVRLASGERVRLIGVNTPELARDGRPAQPLAAAAAAALAQLVGDDGRVWLQDGRDSRDRHGRRLAHLFDRSGASIEAELLRRGLAFHVAVAPNFDYLECLQAAEKDAAAARLGVWAAGLYEPMPVASLQDRQQGFLRVRDEVTRVSFKDNGWWLQLGGKLGVRVDKEVQPLFRRRELRALEGRVVEVRGWLVPMGGWWQMRLSHPSMLVLAP